MNNIGRLDWSYSLSNRFVIIRCVTQVPTEDRISTAETPDKCMDSSEESSGIHDISDQPGPSSTYYSDVSGSGGLVVRCRPRSRRVPDSKPYSTEDPSCFGYVAR
ncbi:hypothetical protein AVEN_137316-1 [Araneus ventricosus]|uniref:Uncharacterized protein n=1 Tax=Araneus ventricosus TaxID=182803 RepID=A0A4Y2FKD0_ARAVE|nr:hypothetical protein AVEN_137316-1 [Araneus ventricosus]